MTTPEQEAFLKANCKILKAIFQSCFNDALRCVCDLPPGPERDGKFYVVREYMAWVESMDKRADNKEKAKEQFI